MLAQYKKTVRMLVFNWVQQNIQSQHPLLVVGQNRHCNLKLIIW